MLAFQYLFGPRPGLFLKQLVILIGHNKWLTERKEKERITLLLCLSQHWEWPPTEQRESDSVKSPSENNGKCFGAKMKNL